MKERTVPRRQPRLVYYTRDQRDVRAPPFFSHNRLYETQNNGLRGADLPPGRQAKYYAGRNTLALSMRSPWVYSSGNCRSASFGIGFNSCP